MSERVPGADRIRHVGIAEASSYRVTCPPASAMGRDDDLRRQLGQVVEHAGDQRLEIRPVEVEPADHRVQRLIAGQPPGVAADVHDPGVPAAGDDDQALAGDVHDQRLVIEDQRVGFPGAAQPGLLRRESRLISGGARYLAGDQDRSVEQEARLTVLDDLEAGSIQGLAARGGYLDRVAARDDHAASAPEVRVDQDWKVRLAKNPDKAVESGGVIEVPVAAHDFFFNDTTTTE